MPEIARNTWIIAKREFKGYFATPLAAVFLTIFVALTGAFTFQLFYACADLSHFKKFSRVLIKARKGKASQPA